MTDTRQKTCEERIDGELADRLADLRVLVKAAQNADSLTADEREGLDNFGRPLKDMSAEDIEDAARMALDEYGLSLEVRRVAVWQLSWGGPSDEIEIDLDGEGGWDEMRYRFKDWFDGAVRRIDSEDASTVWDAIGGWIENV